MLFNKEMKYSELCEELDIPKLRGSYQQKQIKELGRRYQIKKEGRYYTILREYNTMESIENKKFLTIRDYIVPLIYKLCINGKYEQYGTYTRGTILKDLGLINDNFYYANSNPHFALIGIDERLSSRDLFMYTVEVRKMFYQILMSAFDELYDKSLVMVEEVRLQQVEVENELGRVIKKNEPLTDEQKRRILIEEYEYLHRNNINSWSELTYFKLIEAKKEIETITDIKQIKGYKFIYNDEIEDYTNNMRIVELKSAMYKLVEKKILESKRKHIRNIPQDIRLKLVENLHTPNPKSDITKLHLVLDNAKQMWYNKHMV